MREPACFEQAVALPQRNTQRLSEDGQACRPGRFHPVSMKSHGRIEKPAWIRQIELDDPAGGSPGNMGVLSRLPDGRLLSVIDFTTAGGTVVEMDNSCGSSPAQSARSVGHRALSYWRSSHFFRRSVILSRAVGEFGRCLLITVVLAASMPRVGVNTMQTAVMFGLVMWVIIYAALAGSVLHEGYPWRVYAIHAGDGLAKLVTITALLGLWPSRVVASSREDDGKSHTFAAETIGDSRGRCQARNGSRGERRSSGNVPVC